MGGHGALIFHDEHYAIKEGDVLQVISSTESIPKNIPFHLQVKALDGCRAAKLETVFRDDRTGAARSIIQSSKKGSDLVQAEGTWCVGAYRLSIYRWQDAPGGYANGTGRAGRY